MKRALLIICAFFALAVPASALADDGSTPPPCSDTQGPPCSIVVLPPGPCDNSVPGSVCPEGPPPQIINKLDGRLPVGGWKIKSSRIDPLYSKVASALSGVSNAQVRCVSRDDWAFLGPYFGYPFGVTLVRQLVNPYNGDMTFLPDDKTLFNPDVCAQLDLMAYQHKLPRSLNTMVQMANALDTLAHEPQHIGGELDEMTAQCWALQYIEKAGVMIGLPRSYAHRMSQLAWDYIQTTAPMVYQNPGACREGGPLDRHTGFTWGK